MAWEYKTWYARNKSGLLEKRRKKYATNPTYRREIRTRTSDHYHTVLKRTVPKNRRIMKDEDGRKFVTIGKLAEFTGKAVATIRDYHKRGIIPEPETFDTRGWRLYSHKQVLLISRTLREFDKKHIKFLKDVKIVLEENWKENT